MLWRAGNIRQPGATAKVNLALSGLPAFHEDPERLQGRIVIGPSIDYVEKASDARKYGQLAEEPWIEATIPSLVDPSLAPEGRHVMSAIVQSAPRPSARGTGRERRERLGDVTVKTLERFAPGFGELVEARQVITPEDLETDYGLSGGHVQHAEPGLDQFFAWRPLNGEARYRFVLDGLYLAGSGAHPGGGITVDRARTRRDRSGRTDERNRRPTVPDPREHALRDLAEEFDEFGPNDLPQYSDFRGSFYKVPWALDEEAISGAGADIAIVGAPYDEGTSARPGARFGPMAIRSAHVTTGSPWAWSLQTEASPFDALTVVDAGDAPVVPGRPERSLRVIHEKVRRVARAGAIPIVLGGDHSITFPSAAAVARVHDPRARRDRPFRRARRHGDGSVGIADRPRTADAPADRGGMGRRAELHPGRAPRLLAGPGHVRVDARPGHALAHAGRDGGTRRRGGHRRGDRAGVGRSRPDLPLGRHRRRRPGDGAGHRHTGVRGDARPGAAACGPTDRGGRRPRRDGRRGGLTPRTTTRRSRRCSRST